MDVRITVCAARPSKCLPTAVEPVKESFRERGSKISGRITSSLRLVVITLTTPAGIPARCRISTRAKVDRGACEAGLMTVVQPAARAEIGRASCRERVERRGLGARQLATDGER